MKTKVIFAAIVILVGLGFGAISFVESTVEYTDFQSAMSAHRKVQVKGEWLRDKESMFDSSKGQFIFSMKDEKGVVLRVVYDGAQPNNFEMASAIVVKGRYEEGCFHASEILTKCPSKYEGTAQDVEKARQP
jgi:cytochrome c-type biogenesis protein CcmE